MGTVGMNTMVSAVRVVMDENRVSTSLVQSNDIDTLSLNELIERNVLTAARTIELLAPRHMLADAEKYDSGTTAFELEKLGKGKYAGHLSLPDTLLRVVGVKMSDWQREGRLTDSGSPEYACQRSEWLGVGGTPECPVAAVVPREDGYIGLELYASTSEAAALSYMTYVSLPQKDNNGNVNLCLPLKDAITYMAASLTCMTLGESQTAAGLRDEAFMLAEIRMPDSNN